MALWRAARVLEETGFKSRSSIYKMVDAGEFPAPVRLTDYAVAWKSEEVIAWCEARPVANTVRGPHQKAAGR